MCYYSQIIAACQERARILVPCVPDIDLMGAMVTWQANRSKLALASGQLPGTGPYRPKPQQFRYY